MKLITLRDRMEQAVADIRETATTDKSLLDSLRAILDYLNALEGGLAAEFRLDEWLDMSLADNLIPPALSESVKAGDAL